MRCEDPLPSIPTLLLLRLASRIVLGHGVGKFLRLGHVMGCLLGVGKQAVSKRYLALRENLLI
jgi:hypothetical protein